MIIILSIIKSIKNLYSFCFLMYQGNDNSRNQQEQWQTCFQSKRPWAKLFPYKITKISNGRIHVSKI